jgi:hypothetical protein
MYPSGMMRYHGAAFSGSARGFAFGGEVHDDCRAGQGMETRKRNGLKRVASDYGRDGEIRFQCMAEQQTRSEGNVSSAYFNHQIRFVLIKRFKWRKNGIRPAVRLWNRP